MEVEGHKENVFFALLICVVVSVCIISSNFYFEKVSVHRRLERKYSEDVLLILPVSLVAFVTPKPPWSMNMYVKAKSLYFKLKLGPSVFPTQWYKFEDPGTQLGWDF